VRVGRSVQVLLWAAVIFTLSSFPNPPGATGNEWQSNLAHMTEYAILGALAWRWLAAFRPAWSPVVLAAVAWLACLGYGVSDEFHQSFVANRDSSVMDVGFDALGAALAVGVFSIEAKMGNRDNPR
jgi:VanZ family protein